MTTTGERECARRKKRKTQQVLQSAAIETSAPRIRPNDDGPRRSPPQPSLAADLLSLFPQQESVFSPTCRDAVVAANLAASSDELSIIDTYCAALCGLRPFAGRNGPSNVSG